MPDAVPQKLARPLALITIAGSLAMVYVNGITCPAATRYFRALGATNFDLGLLGGLPMLVLWLQFCGALYTNRVRVRKWPFIILCIAGRLLFIPIALLPLVFPSLRQHGAMPIILVLVGLSYGLCTFIVPVWYSWMGDVIPGRILSRYWGGRQGWMTFVGTVAFFVIAIVNFEARDWPDSRALVLYPLIAIPAVIAGVIDIALFYWVPEPPNVLLTGRSVVNLLLEPLRDVRFRRIISYTCAFNIATMMGATFMLVYCLEELHLADWKTTLLWCMPGIGSALVSRAWGRAADRHGSRGIIILCTWCKPVVAMVFVLVTPGSAFIAIALIFLLDTMVQAGINVAVNSYMLRMAPKENRPMFVAAILALGGLCGGLSALGGGWLLDHTQDFRLEFAGRVWNNYQWLFLMSFLMRLIAGAMALRVHEPTSTRTVMLINSLREGFPAFDLALQYPVGLFRRLNPFTDESADEGEGKK